MVKFQKYVGERPAKVVVGRTLVEFDADGIAEVAEEVAEILSQIPNEYRLVDASEGQGKGAQKSQEGAGDAVTDPEGDNKGEGENGADEGAEAATEGDEDADKADEVAEAAEAPAEAAGTPKPVTPPKRKAPTTTKK